MKTATTRDLRHNLSKVETWLSQGNEVLITKRGKPVMRITTAETSEKKRPFMDFGKIRKEVSSGVSLTKRDVEDTWKTLRDEREL
jgi:antitoxin (DNA-binding transcriptional repressor) of toxin-antitoxin stability system